MSAPGTRTILWHLGDILKAEMGLTPNQVWIYSQKRKIPPATGLWVVIEFLTGRPYGSKSQFNSDTLQEEQSVNMSALFTIDIFSRNTEALDRKEEILMAMGSIYAQQLQEKFSFKIGRVPVTFNNLSQVEGTAILYRFQITFQVSYAVEKKKSADYYDTFTHTEETEP